MPTRLPAALSAACLTLVLFLSPLFTSSPLARVAPETQRAASAPAASPRPAELPAQAAAVLKRIKAADSDFLAVSEEDGRLLRLLTATSGAKRVLEIGSANGYSAIWIGLGCVRPGGGS